MGNLTLSLMFWHFLMYMASKCYYMDLLGMSGNINIQSTNNGNTKSDIRTEIMLSDWTGIPLGHDICTEIAKTIIIHDPLREA